MTPAPERTLLLDPRLIEGVVVAIFRAAGSGEREAALIAENLVEADLRGHASHGVGMIPPTSQPRARGVWCSAGSCAWSATATPFSFAREAAAPARS
jgi:hypothetical protein